MSLLGTTAAVVLWLAFGALAYAAVSYLVLLYLPPAERVPSGAVADAAFVVTLPFVLTLTWLSGLRHRG